MELLPSCVFILIVLFGKAQQYEITLDDECGSDLLKSYEDVVNHWWNDLKRIPHLGNMKYIHKLVSFICSNVNKSNCMIIGGPRDSGKTTGLVFLSEAAQKLGHDVFHVNLKSATSSLDIEDIMHHFSWNVINAIQNIEDTDTLQ